MVWLFECKATDSLHKTGGNDTSLPSKLEKKSHKEVLDLTNDQITVHREKTLNKIHLPYMFGPSVTPKHHKQKTPDAETRENRSFPHQLQEGVEHKLRWCESSSAEQPTVYTRHTARTQVFHRSRKKYLKRKHWTLPHAKTFVNQKQCPSKNSPFKYVWPMCYSQRSQTKNARCRHRREQVISTSTPKRSGTCFTMVWIIECKATDSLHKTCGNDTSLPSKQKKTSQKEALDLTTRQNNCEPGKNRPKKWPFKYVRPMCYSQTSQAKNARCRDRREQVISTSTPKRSGTCFTMVWIFECKATDSLHKDLRQWHKSSIEAKKNISQGSIGSYNTPKQLWTGEEKEQKKSPFNHVRPMCYSQRSQAKNARCRHRREQVISTSTPKRSGTCFTMVWIIECKATDSLHKTCGNDTSLPSKQKKISHKEALDLTTRQNNSEPGKKSNKKVAFQLCSTHVLFPKITSKKRQLQTQERTGHFHVHSKEEWNMFYDCVNVRVQSNRQFTQDLRQWHKSSIEAEKNISQGSIASYNTPKQLWTGEKKEQKSRLSIMFDPCVIPKDHKQKTPDADTGENRSFPRPLQRGVEHVLRLCE